MQIYAYDDKGEEQIAHLAEKNKKYWCLECHDQVALRSGQFIRPHFFHLKQSHPCRLSQKSATHLQIQYYLLEHLPGSRMEVHFKSIKRIADIVWECEKLIFEIQISFITAEEVLARNSLYASQGYQVIWLLHENRFNRRRLTAAEIQLASSPHYYTSMNSEGQGDFYDQFSYSHQGQRIMRLFKRPIQLLCPVKNVCISSSLPEKLVNMRKNWPLFFSGDICSSTKFNSFELAKAYDLEKKLAPITKLQQFKIKFIRTLKLIGYFFMDLSTS